MSKRACHKLIQRKVRRALNSTTEGPLRISGRRLLRSRWGLGVAKRDLEGPGDYAHWDKSDVYLNQVGDSGDPDFWSNRKDGPDIWAV